MTVPALHVLSDSPAAAIGDVLVVGVVKTDSGPRLLGETAALPGIPDDLTAIGFGGGVDELRRIPSADGVASSSIALIGVGTDVTPTSLRYAAGSALRQLRGVDRVTVALPADDDDALLAVLEGAAMGAYLYTAYRSAPDEGARAPRDVAVLSAVTEYHSIVARAALVAGAVATVKNLVNTPPSDLFPETLTTEALRLAEDAPVEVEVLREEELAASGFGGILGVGLGSSRGPRLVKVTYSPVEASKHLALVGKGITFDSGGLSLKPPVSMVGMKYDMTGAATVLAVTLAAARLGLNVKITAWLCLAENLPSGTAMRPNDVLRIRGGKTVEVLNTDAEGRLVLADGLVAASEELPDAIVDVATLTGAQRVALGDRVSAVIGDAALSQTLVELADAAGESFWAMPMPAELRAMLNSDVADIANVKPGNTAAGMLVAGVFLREFVGNAADGNRIPWAHLDIAGPSDNGGGGYGFTAKGPTGVTVRALLSLAEYFSVA
ncbi:leucyl aminopeptidase [Galbitalea soli]|uniref:Probable cytosol aminopeptidase n=1 Tax=Galbitalea soli TaxID=1268042 RepID=A0A7C9TNU2_9MICO|nr:leucyl aminopeptidase [Galbitalea soli]NEM90278.1 leucyl aminopeptidase [Galbitalea soli]NYJ30986.1 leucyl aminopeptidase [Galbitalea soli]